MMPSLPADAYASSILRPQLRGLGLNSEQQSIVVSDVCRRLRSLLAHWQDPSFRRTALFFGLEEATFYEPTTVDLEVRALVVTCVRNSLIEDLSASRSSTPGLNLRHSVLADAEMPSITSSAIEYFSACDLAPSESLHEASPVDDLFGSLPASFPNAWRVLSNLANSPDREISYPPSDASPLTVSRYNPPVKRPESVANVILSGIDPTIDPGLTNYLALFQENEYSTFFSDSFKGVTRNIQKLLFIIEFLLCHGAIFLTNNYYIGPDQAARRSTLLRPIHNAYEMADKLSNQLGLSNRHKEALAIIKAQYDEQMI